MKKIAAMGELVLLIGMVLVPAFAFAAGDGTPRGNVITLPNPLGEGTTFTSLLNNFYNFLALQLGPVVVAIMVIIGAYQILFAGGDPEKFRVGKRTIIYTAIAYGILLLAGGLASIIKDFFTSKS